MTNDSGGVNVSEYADPLEYTLHTLFIIEGVWMVVANGLIIVTLLCHKTMRQNQMYTMLALAVADGFYGIGILTGGGRCLYLIIKRIDHLPASAWECMLQFPTTFYIAGSQMTALAMLWISVDRYIAVAHLNWYLQMESLREKTTLFVILFGVATGAVAWLSTFFSFGDDTYGKTKILLCLSTWAVPGWYATYYTTMVAIGGYLSVIIYGLVLVAYRKYVRSAAAAAGQTGGASTVAVQRERRLTVTMAFVTLITLLLHSIPYTIIIGTTLFQFSGRLVNILNPFLWVMVCGNSLANIFIYLRRHKDMRSAMNDVMHGRFKGSPTLSVVPSQTQTNNNALFVAASRNDGSRRSSNRQN